MTAERFRGDVFPVGLRCTVRAMSTSGDFHAPHVRLANTPPSVIVRLQDSFVDWASRNAEPGLLRQLVALLTFDGVLGMAAGGARGGRQGGRQLTFTSEAADLSVHVLDEGKDTCALDGIVLATGDSDHPYRLRLLDAQSGEPAVEATVTDEFGGFRIRNIPRGQYVLVATDIADEISFGPIQLRSDG
jgi:hypothetical protein